ncbi:MAG TPA: phosphopyruvate hydratase [Acidimicrobiales bacterium]|nr:phosphopyruvate hydratase [Acidimicrobiales bacterium]
MVSIASITADWVLDSRATPTVEATVTLDNGMTAFGQTPSGASTGRHESVERRDGDPSHFGGKGVEGAARAIRWRIAPALTGQDVSDQAAIDAALVDLDGTEDRSELGANAILAVSVACARAGALAGGLPLWEHLAGTRVPTLPLPMVNLFSGGAHARGGMGMQDVLVTPFGAPNESTAIEWVRDVYVAASEILTEQGASTLVGDEGGFGAPSASSEDTIAIAVEAIVRAGRIPGREVSLTLDIAATQLLQEDGTYCLDGRSYHPEELIETVVGWTTQYPIVSVEDPLAEDDWDGWVRLAERLDPRVQLVGDDLLCTHIERLNRAAELGCANAVLVKANQIGTVSEALAVADRAAALGLRAVVSARSGETEDDWLADLAVASGAGQIKVGSVVRSERLAKYNRLLRIGRSPGAPPWAGPNGFDTV